MPQEQCSDNKTATETGTPAFKVIYRNGMELWHRQQRATGSHQSPRRMVTLPIGITTWSSIAIRSQEPGLLQATSEIEPTTSQMEHNALPIKSQISSCSRNQDDTVRCLIPMTWLMPEGRQWHWECDPLTQTDVHLINWYRSTGPDSSDKEPGLCDSWCAGSPENPWNSANAVITIRLEDRRQPHVLQE